MSIVSRIQSVTNAVRAKAHHLTDKGRMTLYRAPVPLPRKEFRDAGAVEITTYAEIGAIPAAALRLLLPGRGREAARAEIAGKLERGERWVCLTRGGEPACWLWAAPGASLPGWFVPLNARDIVIYSVFTRYQFRGLGLAPRVIDHAADTLTDEGCMVVCGIALWNEPSIRAFAKLGFEPFASIQLR